MACRECVWWKRVANNTYGNCTKTTTVNLDELPHSVIIYREIMVDTADEGEGCPQFKPRESSDGV